MKTTMGRRLVGADDQLHFIAINKNFKKLATNSFTDLVMILVFLVVMCFCFVFLYLV